MTGFHADRSVLRSFDRPFSAAVAFFKGFILPRWRWLAGRSLARWDGRWDLSRGRPTEWQRLQQSN